MIDFDFDFSEQDLVRIAARLAGTVVTFLLLAWIFRRAKQGQARRRDFSDVLVLEYGPTLRWLFPVFAIGFGALYLFATTYNPAEVENLDAKLFWPVMLIEAMAILGMLETWGVRIELSDHELTSRSPWTGRRRLSWGEVQRVGFSEGWQWFVVQGMEGTRIYLHVLLPGLGAFRAKLRDRLQPAVFGPAEPYFRQLGAFERR